MLAVVFQLAIGIALLVYATLTAQEAPSTEWLRAGVKRALTPLLGEDYEIPALTIAIALGLLAAFALLNAFMMFGAQYGFWVV